MYVAQLSGQRFNINVPHRFAVHNFMRFTFCDHCGSLIYGIMRQGLQCEGNSQLNEFACFTFSFKIVLFTLSKYVDSIYAIARYMPSPVHLSVCPSVCPSPVRHTGGSVEDG